MRLAGERSRKPGLYKVRAGNADDRIGVRAACPLAIDARCVGEPGNMAAGMQSL